MKHTSILLTFLIICTLLKGEVKVINSGIGGNNTAQLLERIDKDVLTHYPDLTIVMVGTNDGLNSRKKLTYDEYATNLTSIVKTLKTAGIEVVLMSSPPVDSTYLFTRHDRRLFTQTPNEIMDSICYIVEMIAKDQDVHFLNLNEAFKTLGLPKHNEDLFIRNPMNSGSRDGVHPTSLGYHFIAENVFRYLKENGLLEHCTKIVCFGDSITHGAGSKGGGTVRGENYPSFLNRKLEQLAIK